jgi:hypothetical protein
LVVSSEADFAHSRALLCVCIDENEKEKDWDGKTKEPLRSGCDHYVYPQVIVRWQRLVDAIY